VSIPHGRKRKAVEADKSGRWLSSREGKKADTRGGGENGRLLLTQYKNRFPLLERKEKKKQKKTEKKKVPPYAQGGALGMGKRKSEVGDRHQAMMRRLCSSSRPWRKEK